MLVCIGNLAEQLKSRLHKFQAKRDLKVSNLSTLSLRYDFIGGKCKTVHFMN